MPPQIALIAKLPTAPIYHHPTGHRRKPLFIAFLQKQAPCTVVYRNEQIISRSFNLYVVYTNCIIITM